MSTPNRAALLTKIHKVLKKHYKPAVTKGDQPLLDTLLLAACLENTSAQVAEEVFATLRSTFIDWNEIRVSTIRELAEAMGKLAEPADSAAHVKGILQSVFEADYTFDLEPLKKKNLGDAVKRLQKMEGATPFVVAYATQTALGGHSIPVDRGALQALVILGVITDKEAATSTVPGMERAIPKSKGQEFGSLLHELGADLVANPFSTSLRDILLSISPDAKDRLPKRGAKKAAEPAPTVIAGKIKGEKAPEKSAGKGKADGQRLEAAKVDAGKAAGKKKDRAAELAAADSAKQRAERDKASKKAADGKKHAGEKKAVTKTLTKRKPR
jgi:endonuclease III